MARARRRTRANRAETADQGITDVIGGAIGQIGEWLSGVTNYTHPSETYGDVRTYRQTQGRQPSITPRLMSGVKPLRIDVDHPVHQLPPRIKEATDKIDHALVTVRESVLATHTQMSGTASAMMDYGARVLENLKTGEWDGIARKALEVALAGYIIRKGSDLLVDVVHGREEPRDDDDDGPTYRGTF